MKIWKPTLESLLNEVFAPVYLQLFSVRRTHQFRGRIVADDRVAHFRGRME